MDPTLLLVHSPLLGPSSWSAVRTAAGDLGIAAIVPDLTGFVDRPRPRWTHLADLAAAAAPAGSTIVVGHSGAGAVLPLIGDRLGERLVSSVYVDAVVPAREDRHETPAPMAEKLDEVTADGRLRPWLDWWPADVVEQLLPSVELRRLLAADSPRVPRDTYDDPVVLPAGWTGRPSAYLRLSDAYVDAEARAAALGWPTRSLVSTHVGIATDPARVLEAVLDLTAR